MFKLDASDFIFDIYNILVPEKDRKDIQKGDLKVKIYKGLFIKLDVSIDDIEENHNKRGIFNFVLLDNTSVFVNITLPNILKDTNRLSAYEHIINNSPRCREEIRKYLTDIYNLWASQINAKKKLKDFTSYSSIVKPYNVMKVSIEENFTNPEKMVLVNMEKWVDNE